jgi:NADH-quinone oxidoreductase subunit L
MLVPLGVLALGAVFSGMVWYNVFFGKEDQLRTWFGMPAIAEHAAEGEHGTDAAPAEGEHGTDAAHAEGEAHAEDAPAEAAHAEAPEADAHGADAHGAADAAPAVAAATGPVAITGSAPQGAIHMRDDNHIIHAAHEVPKWVKVSPFVAMLIGFALAFQFYIRRPELPGILARQQWPLYQFLLNKWYFDEIYAFLFVGPARWLAGFLWKRGDGDVIDGTINGVAMGVIPFFTRLAGRAQNGYVFTYAFAMVIGIALLITWMTLGR